MSPGLGHFALLIDLDGPGPFLLPHMNSVASFRTGTSGCPILQFETTEGQNVLVPLTADAIGALTVEIQAWLESSQNSLNR